MTLVMHLYITLHQDIGLKSFIVTRFSTFGTKAILVALTHLRIPWNEIPTHLDSVTSLLQYKNEYKNYKQSKHDNR
jgi:hypothetical protein